MSSRHYEIGDRVIIIKTKLDCEFYLNIRAIVVSELVTRNTWLGPLDVHEIEPADRMPGHERKRLWASREALIPDYDGNEKVSWDSCVWQPYSVRHRAYIDGNNPQYIVFDEAQRFMHWAKLMDPKRW